MKLNNIEDEIIKILIQDFIRSSEQTPITFQKKYKKKLTKFYYPEVPAIAFYTFPVHNWASLFCVNFVFQRIFLCKFICEIFPCTQFARKNEQQRDRKIKMFLLRLTTLLNIFLFYFKRRIKSQCKEIWLAVFISNNNNILTCRLSNHDIEKCTQT